MWLHTSREMNTVQHPSFCHFYVFAVVAGIVAALSFEACSHSVVVSAEGTDDQQHPFKTHGRWAGALKRVFRQNEERPFPVKRLSTTKYIQRPNIVFCPPFFLEPNFNSWQKVHGMHGKGFYSVTG